MTVNAVITEYLMQTSRFRDAIAANKACNIIWPLQTFFAAKRKKHKHNHAADHVLGYREILDVGLDEAYLSTPYSVQSLRCP